MCNVNGYTNHVLSVASILGLFVITIDRYISIFYPLRYTEYMTSKKAIILILSAWGYAFVTAVLPLVGWSRYTFIEGAWLCVTDFKDSYSFSYFITLSVYGIPLTIMTVMYYRIFKVAFHHSRAIRQQNCVSYGSSDNEVARSYPTMNNLLTPASSTVSAHSFTVSETASNKQQSREASLGQNGDHENRPKSFTATRLHPYTNAEPKKLELVPNNHRRKRRKLLKFKKEIRTGLVLSVIVIIFVISWSPFAILNLWALHSKKRTSIASEAIVSRLAYLNSAINPPLYCLMNKVIRASVKKVWYKMFKFLRIEKFFKCVQPEDKDVSVFEMSAR